MQQAFWRKKNNESTKHHVKIHNIVWLSHSLDKTNNWVWLSHSLVKIHNIVWLSHSLDKTNNWVWLCHSLVKANNWVWLSHSLVKTKNRVWHKTEKLYLISGISWGWGQSRSYSSKQKCDRIKHARSHHIPCHWS